MHFVEDDVLDVAALKKPLDRSAIDASLSGSRCGMG
jgi:hypothetical protein